jgi:hypothetical protein
VEDVAVLALLTVAGLFAVDAHRCRSMTAAPRDHPIVADFLVE